MDKRTKLLQLLLALRVMTAVEMEVVKAAWMSDDELANSVAIEI